MVAIYGGTFCQHESVSMTVPYFDNNASSFIIRRNKKDGGCRFYHNALRT